MDEFTRRMEHTRNRRELARHRYKPVRTSVIINGEEVDFGEYSGAGQYEGKEDRFRFIERSSIYCATEAGNKDAEGTEGKENSDFLDLSQIGKNRDVVKKQKKNVKPNRANNASRPTGEARPPRQKNTSQAAGKTGCGCGCLLFILFFLLPMVLAFFEEFL